MKGVLSDFSSFGIAKRRKQIVVRLSAKEQARIRNTHMETILDRFFLKAKHA